MSGQQVKPQTSESRQQSYQQTAQGSSSAAQLFSDQPNEFDALQVSDSGH
eukprot:CAMPEP_0185592344 /NCGR_PEP_ID=MMETSP0434-20130131/67630_1 /TAXON_ID=626734 ORGANISM="Favella taraikaensis, Strain Fe Narragansett Bay" /NCGR_SAMPLE_ID=MMETSP0434 /ASSEMBLY_ACC=CAM_ASM_000379 /LENGTH=49 /DNA_ID=CAMNT_0028218085 /DNA_START=1215 /DNA_END=1364 /DNA_ORIENTATION=-